MKSVGLAGILLGLACILAVASAAGQPPPPAASDATVVGNTGELQEAIETAYRAGQKNFKIPPGIYHQGQDQANGLTFSGLKDFVIDATGATIVATKLKSAMLEMHRCDHVTLQGGTFTREPMGFSQGEIEAVGEDRQAVDIRVARGYPNNIDAPDFFGRAPKLLGLFDAKTRDWKKGASDLWFSDVQRLGPDLFRFRLGRPLPAGYPLAPGDLAVWRGWDRSGIVLQQCQAMQINGVTVHNSGGFTIWEQGGEGGNHYADCRISRGPAPAGAEPGETPLWSSACDGYHSTSVRHGPTYERCYVEFNDDDAFAIHGHGSLITESKAATITVGQIGDLSPVFETGDTLRLYDGSGTLAGDAKVSAVRPLPGYVCPGVPPPDFRVFLRGMASQRMHYEEVTLDHVIPAAFGWIAVDSDATGNGAVIRGCEVRSNRERGMLIKASDVLIENCLVDGSTEGGIVFCPEVAAWDEVDFTRNTVIRNNTIRNISVWPSNKGALNISEWRGHNMPVPLPGGHRDILVEGNTFQNDDGVNIVVTSAERVTFRDNRFVEPMTHPWAMGWDIPAESLYWITQSKDIIIQGNQITRPGPCMKTVVQTTDSAKNVTQKLTGQPQSGKLD